jgi:hypothetical protein
MISEQTNPTDAATAATATAAAATATATANPTSAPQEQYHHEDVVGNHADNKTHPKTNQPHSRIVAIALDASPYSVYAFDWAFENIVKAETDQVVLLNVREPVVMPSYYDGVYVEFSKEIVAMEAESRKASHDLLREFAKKLPPHQYNIRGVALRGMCVIQIFSSLLYSHSSFFFHSIHR